MPYAQFRARSRFTPVEIAIFGLLRSREFEPTCLGSASSSAEYHLEALGSLFVDIGVAEMYSLGVGGGRLRR